MYIHLSRHELLTTLSALQQGRAYRRNSKRYIRKSVENGVITEEFAAERIAHAEMICGRYTALAAKIRELLAGGDPKKVQSARETRRQESASVAKTAAEPESQARNALHKHLAARKARREIK